MTALTLQDLTRIIFPEVYICMSRPACCTWQRCSGASSSEKILKKGATLVRFGVYFDQMFLKIIVKITIYI